MALLLSCRPSSPFYILELAFYLPWSNPLFLPPSFPSYWLPLYLIQDGNLSPPLLVSGASLLWFLSRVRLVMLVSQNHCRYLSGEKLEGSTRVTAQLLKPAIFAVTNRSLCCGSQLLLCESVEGWVWGREAPVDANTPTPLGRVSCPCARAGATAAGAFVTLDLVCGPQQSSVVWPKLSPRVIRSLGSEPSECSPLAQASLGFPQVDV